VASDLTLTLTLTLTLILTVRSLHVCAELASLIIDTEAAAGHYEEISLLENHT